MEAGVLSQASDELGATGEQNERGKKVFCLFVPTKAAKTVDICRREMLSKLQTSLKVLTNDHYH